MNLYTKWEISDDGRWYSTKPVDFEALLRDGWFKAKDLIGIRKSEERSKNSHV
jgi:hypothetical protein